MPSRKICLIGQFFLMIIKNSTYKSAKSAETFIFWLLIMIHLIPLWSVHYFPSQDGPVHLENAVILNTYTNPESELIRQYYYVNTSDPSNWLIQLVLSALILVFPPLIAVKVLISGYIILLPLAFRYCLNAFNPNSTAFSFLAFPFIYNYTLHMGFFGFCFSLVMFFFLLGIWIKIRNQQTFKTGFIFSTLILTTYLLHIVSLVMSIAAIFLLTLSFYVYDLRIKAGNHAVEQLKQRLTFLLVTCLPVILLILNFFSRQGTDITYSSFLKDRLIQFAGLTSLYSFVRTELIFSCTLALMFAVLSLFVILKKWQIRRLERSDMLLVIFISYVMIYFAAPDTIAGGAVINARLLLYPYFILMIWLGCHAWGSRIRRTVIIIATGISLIYLGSHVKNYNKINRFIEEYSAAADLIEKNRILLPLSFYESRSALTGVLPRVRINPFIHLSAYLAIEKGIIELDNYQAWSGYFPIQYRPHLNPMTQLAVNGQLESIPPVVNIIRYKLNTGKNIDYILIWGLEEKAKSSSGAKAILRQIDRDYSIIYESGEQNILRVYRSDLRNPYHKGDDQLTRLIF